jgi:hypothetical protein
MNPIRVNRTRLKDFTDLPNIGKAMAGDFRLLGYRSPEQIAGEDPFEMYARLCEMTGQRQDPCVLDVFMSVTRFLNGERPKPWWEFTEERKKILAAAVRK